MEQAKYLSSLGGAVVEVDERELDIQQTEARDFLLFECVLEYVYSAVFDGVTPRL